MQTFLLEISFNYFLEQVVGESVQWSREIFEPAVLGGVQTLQEHPDLARTPVGQDLAGAGRQLAVVSLPRHRLDYYV